jgi:hypothetical protein
MGYEYFYQNIAEWLLLNMLIFIDSPLQILISDNFFLSMQPQLLYINAKGANRFQIWLPTLC